MKYSGCDHFLLNDGVFFLKTKFEALFIVAVLVVDSCRAEGELQLQPHRAYYTVTMETLPSPQNPLRDIRGTMMVELSKSCGGWTAQQFSEVWRYYDDDSIEHVKWGHVTWEADDGSRFKFNTFRKSDDELVEDIRGVATKRGKAIEVTYQKPEKITIVLPEATLFPQQQVKALLKTAEEGEHVLSRVVFDGSTAQGALEINAFIGAKKIIAGNPNQEATSQFASQPFWPIRFSIYEMGKVEYESDYTTTQELLPNGIIKKYVIESSGVKIKGVLERVELLSESDCS